MSRSGPSPPERGGEIRAPTIGRAVLVESLLLWDLLRLAGRLPGLLHRVPHGDGAPVIAIPGYGASDLHLWPLRRFLAGRGHDVRGWGLGRNHGHVESLVSQITESVEALATESGRRVALVGWSLGGVIGREVARNRPELVRRVVTLGTPVVGGPRYTAVAWRFRRRGFDLDRIEASIAEAEATPIEVPVTAIWSRRDGIVAWRASIERDGRPPENLEIGSSHLGLVVHPEAWRRVAERLAATD